MVEGIDKELQAEQEVIENPLACPEPCIFEAKTEGGLKTHMRGLNTGSQRTSTHGIAQRRLRHSGVPLSP